MREQVEMTPVHADPERNSRSAMAFLPVHWKNFVPIGNKDDQKTPEAHSRAQTG
jgi:hypothetical protein